MLAINWGNVGIVTLVGFGLVFVVLVLLIFILQVFGKIMAPKAKVRKGAEVATTSAQPVTPESESDYIPALDSAAIATALHLYFKRIRGRPRMTDLSQLFIIPNRYRKVQLFSKNSETFQNCSLPYGKNVLK